MFLSVWCFVRNFPLDSCLYHPMASCPCMGIGSRKHGGPASFVELGEGIHYSDTLPIFFSPVTYLAMQKSLDIWKSQREKQGSTLLPCTLQAAEDHVRKITRAEDCKHRFNDKVCVRR